MIWRDDVPVPLEQIVPADLSDWKYLPGGEQVALDPRLGRIVFAEEYPPDNVQVSFYQGFAAAIGGGGYPRPNIAKAVYQVPADDNDPTDKFDGLLKAWEAAGGPDAFVEFSNHGAYPATDPATHRTKVGQMLATVLQDFQSAPTLRYRVGPRERFQQIGDALKQWETDESPDAVIEIFGSGVYAETIEIDLPPGKRLTVRAADGERP